MDRIKTYQDEENELLYTLLDKRFFSVFRNPNSSLWRSTSMELFITPDCNLACEYCYLNKYKDSLYPKEARNKAKIIDNLHKILSWMHEESFILNDLELFSGEIWHLPFGFEVLDIIHSYMEKGLRIQCITIPTNSCFACDEDVLNRMQDVIDRFSGVGCRLMISHSIEGKVLENVSRPLKKNDSLDIRSDEFYERLFAFAKKNTFYFHPMVAAANIEQWPDNYDWFKDMCNKYDIPFPRAVMMLEVRNSDWTPEKLEHLKYYYKHQIDYLWKESNHDIETFLAKSFGITGPNAENVDGGYSNIAFPLAKTQAGCSIPSVLTIRVGDLEIVPCHRAAYPQFSYGKLKVEDNKINGVEATNTQAATKILYSNNFVSHHGCDVCVYNGFCMRCCYGEQYEEVKEIFMPDPNVCNMFKAKYNYLIDTYAEMGVLGYMSEIPSTDTRYVICQEILTQVDRINEVRRAGQCMTL